MRAAVSAIAVASGLAACDPDEMRTGVPPWHMWGDEKTIDVTSAGASGQGETQQIARVNYKRPETWRFFFVAELLEGSSTAGGAVFVIFRTTIGVGRTSTSVPLGTFRFNVGAGAIVPTIKFSNHFVGPPNDDSAAAVQNVIDHFVAQDIQCQVQVVYQSGAGDKVTLRAAAYFAPEGHIRPEWFAPGPLESKFSGSETGGQ